MRSAPKPRGRSAASTYYLLPLIISVVLMKLTFSGYNSHATTISHAGGYAQIGGRNERLSSFLRQQKSFPPPVVQTSDGSRPRPAAMSVRGCAGWCAATTNCPAFSYQEDPLLTSAAGRASYCRLGSNSTAREAAPGARTYKRLSSEAATGDLLSSGGGLFFRYPASGGGAYGNYLDMWWCFRSQPGTVVRAASAGGWEIEDRYDFVEIYDGCGSRPTRLLATYYYPVAPDTVTSTTNEMTVHFSTDGSNSLKPYAYTGFSLNLTAV